MERREKNIFGRSLVFFVIADVIESPVRSENVYAFNDLDNIL